MLVETAGTDSRYFYWRSIIIGGYGPEQGKNNRETTLLLETKNTAGTTDCYNRYENTVTFYSKCVLQRNEKIDIEDPGVPKYYHVK